MKRIIVVLSVLPILVFSQSLQKKRKVLFIGNSYTYVNNLPFLIYNIALANGDTMLYDSSCPGGYTFFNHTNDINTKAKIYSGTWDYVVLQAQSQEPSFSPSQVNSQTLPFAIALDTMIKNHNTCATTVFYETWGRKFGDASNCAFYPPVCTYTGMQARLKTSYKMFADTCDGLMVPVGEAFKKSISTNPNLELYQSDQSHPSMEGSYLAAASFYEILFQKSVLSNTYNPGIASGTLSFLQQVAHNVNEDSLLVWNLGRHSPKAEFTSTLVNNAQYQFDATFPFLNHTWYFGDGNIGYGTNVQHQYTSSGHKIISHVVDDGCKKDSMSLQITASISTSDFEKITQDFNDLVVYPNPITDVIHFAMRNSDQNNLFTGELYNQYGQLLFKFFNKQEISVESLKPGIYLLKINDAAASKKMIKIIKTRD